MGIIVLKTSDRVVAKLTEESEFETLDDVLGRLLHDRRARIESRAKELSQEIEAARLKIEAKNGD